MLIQQNATEQRKRFAHTDQSQSLIQEGKSLERNTPHLVYVVPKHPANLSIVCGLITSL